MPAEIGFSSLSASLISRDVTTKQNEVRGATVERGSNPVAVEKNSRETQVENREPDLEALQDSISKINDSIQAIRNELHISVDQDSGRLVVKVIDAENGETIRQIPSEELLQLAQQLSEGDGEGRLLQVTA